MARKTAEETDIGFLPVMMFRSQRRLPTAVTALASAAS